MTRTIIAALVAATALTATAADARTSARQRGVASGQEARERMMTRDLNAQQLNGATQTAMAPAAATSPGTAMPASEGQPAPETATPMTETTPPADSTVPQSDTPAPRN